jgi:hypothetical protein
MACFTRVTPSTRIYVHRSDSVANRAAAVTFSHGTVERQGIPKTNLLYLHVGFVGGLMAAK